MKYNILKIATLILPLTVYLFLQATIFKITPDVRIYDLNEHLTVIEYEDMYFIYNGLETKYDGLVMYYNGQWGVVVDDKDVIKTNNGYFVVRDGVLENIKSELIRQEQSYILPITFFISLFGIGIVSLVVLNKMQLYKKYPRVSVLVSLTTGTGILYILNAVIGGILGVFMVATISWAVYCLEYWVEQGKLSKVQAEKTESDLSKALDDALKKIKGVS